MILHSISSFNQATMQISALLISKGLALCLSKPGPLKNEITNTPDFWLIMRNLRNFHEAAPSVFELIESVMIENVGTGASSSVTSDNYEFVVSLLNDFATAGSIGAIIEQKRDRSARKAQPVKQSKTR